MSPKKQAIQDIREELQRNGRCFLAFHSELNPIMRRLVNNQIKLQQSVKSKVKKIIH